jgi:hypothetical protein
VAGTFTVDRIVRPRATSNPVPIAIVSCLSSVSCKLSTPRTVRLRIKTRAYTLRVVAPSAVGAGDAVPIGVRIPRPARRMLRIHESRQLKLKVKITAGGTTTPTTLRPRFGVEQITITFPSHG